MSLPQQKLDFGKDSSTQCQAVDVTYINIVPHPHGCVQPASHIVETDLNDPAANNKAKIIHLLDSMKKAHDRRHKCQEQAYHLSARVADLEANLIATKQQAAAAQENVRAAENDLQELNQQCDLWEQQLEAVAMTLQNAKRRRRMH